ncbi:MAG: diaminobutyrate acetyltransferase [Candidatus Nitrospinota bacterium M3_3B_026]
MSGKTEMTKRSGADEAPVALRGPERADGKSLYDLVRSCPPLDVNSVYAYYLVAEHFAGTSVVAEVNGRTAGFVSAYIPPGREDTLFVWQVAVSPDARGRGLAGRMLREILSRPALGKIRHVETTITPSNEASKRLFSRLAERLGCGVEKEIFIPAEWFGEGSHEEEVLFRIGPFENVY